MNHPDVILRIHRNADSRTQNPMVRQRLRPHRIYFEHWRLGSTGGLDLASRFKKLRSELKGSQNGKYDRAENQTAFHGHFSLTGIAGKAEHGTAHAVLLREYIKSNE